jgi:hypothetical protein
MVKATEASLGTRPQAFRGQKAESSLCRCSTLTSILISMKTHRWFSRPDSVLPVVPIAVALHSNPGFALYTYQRFSGI